MKKNVLTSPYLLLSVGVLSVAISSIFVKWATAPASVLAMYRLLLTVLFLLPFRPWKSINKESNLVTRDYLQLFFSGLFLALHFLFWMGSLRYTSVASSMIILSLSPVFTMIGLFFFFKARTTKGKVASLVIAIVGSLIIAWGDIGLSHAALYGDFLSLLGCIAYAIHLLFGQSLVKKISGQSYSFIVFLISGVLLLIYNIIFKVELINYSLTNWVIFLLLALFSTILGHMLFNISLKYLDASVVSMATIGEPILAIFLAFLLLGEDVTILQIIGSTITVVGIGLFFKPEKNKITETD